MLPCEFCEELFPEEDLILHQVSDFILLVKVVHMMTDFLFVSAHPDIGLF